MTNTFKTLLAGFLILAVQANAQAQDPERFANEIAKYKQIDAQNSPKKGQVLFVGSSSIRKWKDIADYFPNHDVINRGFGGSQFSDLIYYADRIIFPYHPSKIFIYEGDNDLNAGESIKSILKEAKALRKTIAKKLPGVPVIFISPKASLSRWKMHEKYEELNAKLEKYAQKTKNTEFADTWTAMLAENGKVRTDIFLEDNLHMNAKGYAIWKKVLLPFLEAE